MAASPLASFLRDPVTTTRKERIEHYRAQAARYRQLAEQQQSSVREGLLDLAGKCDAMASSLAPMRDRIARPELCNDDLLLLLDQAIDEAEKTESAAALVCRQSPPQQEAARELSLDEILQKVPRDLAEGRPAA
jgi:hypothetical protein